VRVGRYASRSTLYANHRHMPGFTTLPLRGFGEATARLLNGKVLDIGAAELGRRGRQAEPDHPDPAGRPSAILEDLDLQTALRRLADSEDQTSVGSIDTG
jgi:hypothetical protein